MYFYVLGLIAKISSPWGASFAPPLWQIPTVSREGARGMGICIDRCIMAYTINNMVVPDSDTGGYKVMAVSHSFVKSYVIITLKRTRKLLVMVVIHIGCS
jgi:hypothetical protein